jgi:hypothetical protein
MGVSRAKQGLNFRKIICETISYPGSTPDAPQMHRCPQLPDDPNVQAPSQGVQVHPEELSCAVWTVNLALGGFEPHRLKDGYSLFLDNLTSFG